MEARTLTEYLARAIESSAQRDFRHSVKNAAQEHHGRLINDFEKASTYHEAARELSSEVNNREPKFTDREKINLEIYGERQNDPHVREQFLAMARDDDRGEERDRPASVSR